jgi:hypothetical protein
VRYAYLVEFFMAWYSGEDFERRVFWNRLFGPYWWAAWTMLVNQLLNMDEVLNK